jgi:hypothetical protein
VQVSCAFARALNLDRLDMEKTWGHNPLNQYKIFDCAIPGILPGQTNLILAAISRNLSRG